MAHPKGLLIERAQKLGLERPIFNTAKTGPEHEPSVITHATLHGQVIGPGQGKSKKDSEKAAAEEALTWLEQGGAGSGKAAKGKTKAAKGGKVAAKSAGANTGKTEAAKSSTSAAAVASQSDLADDDDEGDDGEFAGPWPMFDDLLASVVQVAEKRVSADLRGPQAMEAIRDFSLQLYKELLADLGEVVDEDDEEDDND